MKNLKNTLFAIVALSTLIACNKDNKCISGSGEYISRDYTVSSFDGLSVGGIADVFITKDSTTSLRIEGQENILNALSVKQNNSTIIIGDDNCFKNMKTLKIYTSTPELISVSASGTCNVTSNNTFTSNVFNVNVSGTGTLNLALNVQEINCITSGDANIVLTGNATSQNYNCSGIANFRCFDLLGENADINISGDAEFEVNISNALNVDISGMGTVYYKGNPTIEQKISGSGSIVGVE